MTKKFKRNLYLITMAVLMILLVNSSELICKECIFEFFEEVFDYDTTLSINDWTALVLGLVLEWTVVTKLFTIGKKFYSKLEKNELWIFKEKP